MLLVAAAQADDWPTYQHDHARSGVSQEKIILPLHEQWEHVADQAPRPAWPAPAKQDYWHILHLKSITKTISIKGIIVPSNLFWYQFL